MFGQNLCIVVICMLVKFPGQFVYMFAWINFLRNQAWTGKMKGKQTYLHLQLKFTLGIYKTIPGQPQITLVKFT
jgi:hypothetical protein